MTSPGPTYVAVIRARARSSTGTLSTGAAVDPATAQYTVRSPRRSAADATGRPVIGGLPSVPWGRIISPRHRCTQPDASRTGGAPLPVWLGVQLCSRVTAG